MRARARNERRGRSPRVEPVRDLVCGNYAAGSVGHASHAARRGGERGMRLDVSKGYTDFLPSARSEGCGPQGTGAADRPSA